MDSYGKLSNESKFKSENSLLVHSLLTNREKISDLWELDSLGIKDPSEKRSKLELQDLALKHFENTILRDDEETTDRKSDPQEIQVLGLMWNVKEDTFSISYRETESKEEVTKRRILSLAHRIFRPDWIHVSYHPHPQITYTRVLEDRSFMGLQITSRHRKKIRGVEKTTYREIQDIKIPRRLSNLDLKDANLSLQVFCDASKLSYATCIFFASRKRR
ncbi:integrase_H2C2 domain-containing protein [Trichonephila clavata]|uniref:Integrase_H2C2 domain-containing protein n=1 Tax=Trichonephila clavata TaxID=2740835 RepID=A0A8X6JH36_TRICU|nr:integrase_H2C2 domain-containing protein [Trichonephila clavata]